VPLNERVSQPKASFRDKQIYTAMKTILSSKSVSLRIGRLVSIILFLLSLVLPSCSEKQPETAAPPKPERGAQDRVVIKGSNTIGEELAPRLIAEYKKDHPKVLIDLETKGSG